ncbi:M48 family metallopeptidase [Kerstersia gyiorum]|uniref:Peptidase M48 n=1 Tax=Kerstersia gyiorum TaxID=206506 RepID=A0A171KPA2_9BURK|nr:M48 family metallopeptidase [Kerstersia gyiorum]KKO70719.1 peptidase M48 [Kerstersia gyiorum]MCP1680194.1 STE24 endopeptidase [Kerstersia gyiorum]MCP1713865.1 STE24 endopeptidase [Kerstersia gyiorum]MCP1824798.1 STE24 endopeptidase [Kerstersia gyiorum]MCP1828137.1 STE24 endopeptidase [Kerstersia gyiorum]
MLLPDAFPSSLTWLFLAALVLNLLVKRLLGWRHARHVQAHRDRVPEAFAGHIGLFSHQRAANYTVARLRLGWLNTCADAVVLLILTLGGGLAALDSWIAAWQWPPLAHQLALLGLALLVMAPIDLVFNWWRHFRLEARFGFNRMTQRLFVADTIKGTLLSILLGAPLSAAVLALMASGPYWWLYAWLLWSAFSLFIMLVFPAWIAPLFNRFSPLNDDALGARIHALAQRCGFALNGLYVMDGSRRSAHGNAYFTGMGKMRRIVFFDTLLAKLNHDEIEAVLAHELGHFRHGHIRQRLLLAQFLSLVTLGILAWLAAQPGFYTAFNAVPANASSQPAMALLLFFLVSPVFTFFLTPVRSWLSRRHEYQADAYAAAQSQPAFLVAALLKLYNDNAATLTPDPVHSAFYDTHPPAALRIAHLNQLEQAA